MQLYWYHKCQLSKCQAFMLQNRYRTISCLVQFEFLEQGSLSSSERTRPSSIMITFRQKSPCPFEIDQSHSAGSMRWSTGPTQFSGGRQIGQSSQRQRLRLQASVSLHYSKNQANVCGWKMFQWIVVGWTTTTTKKGQWDDRWWTPIKQKITHDLPSDLTVTKNTYRDGKEPKGHFP